LQLRQVSPDRETKHNGLLTDIVRPYKER